MADFIVRKFAAGDRQRVREISCATAFLELPRKGIFSDEEILADILTLYFTDYEPEFCFVAVADGRVCGYLTGAKDARLMDKRCGRVFPRVFFKALARGFFFRWVNLRFLWRLVWRSLLRGEFAMPDFSAEYPAMLHINMESSCRGRGIGERLINAYLQYLRESGVKGVHFGSFSERAKGFFLKQGFEIVFQGRRSYLEPNAGQRVNFYVFAKKIL